MIRILLDLKKSVEQNASAYFEKAKKARQKADRAKEALVKSESRLERFNRRLPEQKTVELKRPRKKEWYERFRWFYSSEGFLVIGGRDATSNEIVIKKHAEKDDIVFHTDMAGSPFFVIKTCKRQPGNATLQEAADATACYSRAWKLGLSTTDVFYVSPEQVSKTAKSGESLPHGAFMIYGKTTYLKPEMRCAVGLTEKGIMGGPVTAVAHNSKSHVVVIQGEDKPSDCAKRIRMLLCEGDNDEIIRSLPPGNCKIIELPAKRLDKGDKGKPKEKTRTC
ncbi:DUF814 domain-containing protein [Candidatus Woesearchaeota archaeon]|nr:DUF814 domain-containing protein [Candidatus Woesearchaeota archaeon]